MRWTVVANAIAATVDIGLALLFVPVFDAAGAALANAGGQATYSVAMLAVSFRVIGPGAWRLWSLIPSLLASALGAVVGWTAFEVTEGIRPAVGVATGIVAFALCYGAAAVAVGVLTADDARWLESAVGGRHGRHVGRIARYVTIRSTRAQATSG